VLTKQHTLFTEVGTNFADKRRSLGRFARGLKLRSLFVDELSAKLRRHYQFWIQNVHKIIIERYLNLSPVNLNFDLLL
jgi:hypothetical protein